MRSYGIKFIAVAAIIVIALSFFLRSSSDDSAKYAGGTLIKAGEESVYAFSTDCEAVGYEGVEAFIDGNSDNLVYVREPKV